jgi:hypothetical protein
MSEQFSVSGWNMVDENQSRTSVHVRMHTWLPLAAI